MISKQEIKEKKANLNYTKAKKRKIPRDIHEKIINLEFKLIKEYNLNDLKEMVVLLKVNIK